jgi:hypothetical protein
MQNSLPQKCLSFCVRVAGGHTAQTYAKLVCFYLQGAFLAEHMNLPEKAFQNSAWIRAGSQKPCSIEQGCQDPAVIKEEFLL